MGPGSDDGGRLADTLASAGPDAACAIVLQTRRRSCDWSGGRPFRVVLSCWISRRAGLMNRSRKVLEPRWHCAILGEKLQQAVAGRVWNVDDEAALRLVVP